MTRAPAPGPRLETGVPTDVQTEAIDDDDQLTLDF